jgi:endoglucanase
VNHDTPPDPARLRSLGDAHEQELLMSAVADQPSDETRAAALRAVLTAHRTRRRAAFARSGVLGAGLLAAAASIFLYQRREAPHLSARAETPLRALENGGAPSASANASASASAASDDALSPCSSPMVAAGKEPLIDDFEDGDSRAPMLEHRAGNWYVFNDGTGVQVPKLGTMVVPTRIPGGNGASQSALFSSGSKFTKWGAVLSFEFTPRRCYDASAYDGIEFLARGRGEIWVSIKMTQVITEDFGGSCKHDCFDGHQKLIRLSPRFQTYRVAWEELHQMGFGAPVPFDPRSLHSVEFSVHPEQTPFSFWVDDVSFSRR